MIIKNYFRTKNLQLPFSLFQKYRQVLLIFFLKQKYLQALPESEKQDSGPKEKKKKLTQAYPTSNPNITLQPHLGSASVVYVIVKDKLCFVKHLPCPPSHKSLHRAYQRVLAPSFWFTLILYLISIYSKADLHQLLKCRLHL